jgi:hypothetical protein
MYSLAVVEQASINSRRRIKYPEPMHRDMQEDSDYFGFVLNWDTIEKFMNNWKYVEDFDVDTRMGHRIWYELSTMIYLYLDLDNSKNGDYIRGLFENSDSYSDGAEQGARRRILMRNDHNDVYLQEMQTGFHGGDWSKV